jgi:hypothetical protein
MCNHCKDNFIVKATSNEISWQGDPVTELDICVNDSLTYVGNIILSKIKDLLKGKGIVLDDLTLNDCAYLNGLLGVQEKNLLNVLDIYKDAICALKAATDLNATNMQAFTDVALYTLGCIAPLDPCGDPLTFKSMIQAIITKLCALDTQFQSIATTILDAIEEGTGNMLIGGAVTSAGENGYITSGTGASAQVIFQALVPPNCPIIYTGATGAPFFDVNGIGLPNTAYQGWYLCNGSNGTPNASTLPQNGGGTIKYIIRFT